jgi:phosphoesterase RecJ-like protein
VTDARARLADIRDRLLSASEVVLTTHLNPDGDGAGSQAALARWLQRNGVGVTITNASRIPDNFTFLLPDGVPVADPRTEAPIAIQNADLAVVLDTSERTRLGDLWEELRRKETVVIDHHPPDPEAVGDLAVRDPTACATGELVYELITMEGGDLELAEARGLYVALVSDTGSFRFSNTTPRTHQIASHLLECGVDPTEMYRRLFGRMTMSRVELLQRALGTLQRDDELPVAWLILTQEDMRETGADTEDREGLVEYARRLEGVEVAMLFRELPDGRTKVSFRSNGETDVSKLARSFQGGGHEKAAGALVNLPMDEALDAVLAEVRAVVGSETL